jgi:NTP pyrophosphatase (non-canonical NTP hydrolase)
MEDYQKQVDAWFKEKGWPYWDPHVITARLFEEGGEFARLVNHAFGPKKKKDGEAEQDFEDEMGDIMYTLICFANSQGLSLDRAMQKSIDKVTGRDKDRF